MAIDEKTLKAIAGMTPAEFAAMMARVAEENRALASISAKAQNLAKVSDASKALQPAAVKALVKAFGPGALSMRVRQESRHVLSFSYWPRKARDLRNVSLDLSLFGSGKADLRIRFSRDNAHVDSLSIVPQADSTTLVEWVVWENVPGCRELVATVTAEGTLADARWEPAKPSNAEKVHFNIMTGEAEAEAEGK
jgi:hypothetical protein